MKIITIEEVIQFVKQIKKSEFQNCCNCKFFPLNYNSNYRGNFYFDIGWVWGVPNTERIEFTCQYLEKRVSQAIKPFKSNCCLCFREVV